MSMALQTPLKRIRILMIEDNLGDATLLRSCLKKAYGSSWIQISHAQSLQAAQALLEKESFDIITVDLHLPDSLDLDSVITTKRLAPHVPLIVVSGWSDREAARRALRLGAQDYIIKGRLAPETIRWNFESAMERQLKFNASEEQRKAEIERNQTKDEILSMSAHDIRGPLIGVIAYLDSIVRGDFIQDLSPQHKRVFELMLANCEQVLNLSDEIVHAKKKSIDLFSAHRELIHLENFMRDFVQEVQGRALEKKIHIELEMLNAPRVYFFDSQLIKRALSNLIQNAISHSPEQAVIRLSVSRHREALRFEVQDAGPGIAQDLRDQLFNEPTERSRDHAEGTNKGLGLVIVRRIAEAHGGRVWLDSSNHPGAKFCIEIKPMH